MAFAANGRLHIAIYSGGAVKVIVVPGANLSICAFDRSGRPGLVVAEAENGWLLTFAMLGPRRADLFKINADCLSKVLAPFCHAPSSVRRSS